MSALIFTRDPITGNIDPLEINYNTTVSDINKKGVIWNGEEYYGDEFISDIGICPESIVDIIGGPSLETLYLLNHREKIPNIYYSNREYESKELFNKSEYEFTNHDTIVPNLNIENIYKRICLLDVRGVMIDLVHNWNISIIICNNCWKNNNKIHKINNEEEYINKFEDLEKLSFINDNIISFYIAKGRTFQSVNCWGYKCNEKINYSYEISFFQ